MREDMRATGRLNLPALRILTYNILIKAVISAVMLVCIAAADVGLIAPALNIAGVGDVSVVARTAEFVNIVAFVMCLREIAAISRRFVTVQRIVIASLITECFAVVLIMAAVYLTVFENSIDMAFVVTVMLSLFAVEKLLIGTAFLFLMKGFADGLRDIGDVSVGADEKLGVLYLCCNIVGVTCAVLAGPDNNFVLVTILALLHLSNVILEIMMYIKVSDAAQQIWKKCAFSD